MENTIPSATEVRDRLAGLTRAQLVELAETTGTPFHTLRKIKSGETLDPKLETVRAVWPSLSAKRKSKPRKKAEA